MSIARNANTVWNCEQTNLQKTFSTSSLVTGRACGQ